MADVADLMVDQNGKIFGFDVSKAFKYPSVVIKGFEIHCVNIVDGTTFSTVYSADVGDSAKTETQRLAAVAAGFALIPAGSPTGIGIFPEVNLADTDGSHQIHA